MQSIDRSEAEFVERCQKALDAGANSMDAQILSSVLAGADYRTFVRMMSDVKAMQPNQSDAKHSEAKGGSADADAKGGNGGSDAKAESKDAGESK